MNHNLTWPHAQQGGTCPRGKPACLRHRGSSIVDQSAGDWSLTAGRGSGFDGAVAAGGFSFGWTVGVAAGVGAAEVVGEGIDSAANTGNVSASGA